MNSKPSKEQEVLEAKLQQKFELYTTYSPTVCRMFTRLVVAVLKESKNEIKRAGEITLLDELEIEHI